MERHRATALRGIFLGNISNRANAKPPRPSAGIRGENHAPEKLEKCYRWAVANKTSLRKAETAHGLGTGTLYNYARRNKLPFPAYK